MSSELRHMLGSMKHGEGPNAVPLLNVLFNPEWTKAERVHDWRNHVPETLKQVWPALCLDVKVLVYMEAIEAANNENWD